jgi:hypothetical protein
MQTDAPTRHPLQRDCWAVISLALHNQSSLASATRTKALGSQGTIGGERRYVPAKGHAALSLARSPWRPRSLNVRLQNWTLHVLTAIVAVEMKCHLYVELVSVDASSNFRHFSHERVAAQRCESVAAGQARSIWNSIGIPPSTGLASLGSDNFMLNT